MGVDVLCNSPTDRTRNGVGLAPDAAPDRVTDTGGWRVLMTLGLDGDKARRNRRAGRHDARSVLWRESALTRVQECGRVGVLPGGSVMVRAAGAGADRRGGFAGVSTCGSTWACPVCSWKIAAARADELAAAITAHERTGGRVCMVTLTMRHDIGHSLLALWEALSYSWGKVTSGRGWLTDKQAHGVTGWVRVVEATYGKNGWHLHVHSLLFMDHVAGDDYDGLGASMFQRWRDGLVRQGMRAPLAGSGGLDVRLVRAGDSGMLGDYFTKAVYDGEAAGKAAREVTMGGSKGGRLGNRTPFQLLADVVALGESRDLALWHEWEAASRGKRQLTWSKGLREQLLRGEVEQTDEQLAEEQLLDGEDVLRLPAASWRAVVEQRLTAVLLDAVEQDDDGAALRGVLSDYGIGWEAPDE